MIISTHYCSRLIDSAQAYNESAVGEAIRDSSIDRSHIFIVSKVHPKNLGYEPTVKSIEDSLANLKTDYIDLMLIHSKDCDEGPDALLVCGEGEPKGDWKDTWRAFEEFVSKGIIHSIGVSNFELEDLEVIRNISSVELSVVQNWFDPFNRDDAVREWCSKNSVAYMGYRYVFDLLVNDRVRLRLNLYMYFYTVCCMKRYLSIMASYIVICRVYKGVTYVCMFAIDRRLCMGVGYESYV